MYNLNNVGELLFLTRTRAGLGLRQAARRAGTSHATLCAYEKNKKMPSVATFLRLVESYNFSLEVSLQPRIRQRNELKRGDELIEVLNLADQFPASPPEKMQFPKFTMRK